MTPTAAGRDIDMLRSNAKFADSVPENAAPRPAPKSKAKILEDVPSP
jgi:hypothetical protein